jgi:ankyrin repeat protein
MLTNFLTEVNMKESAELMAAIQGGDKDKLQTLLSKDPALAAARDEKGVSAIMTALYQRRSDLLVLLLAARPAMDIFDATAVGRPEQVAELLKNHCELATSWSPDGFTALHFACYFGQESTGRLLLESGADPAAVARNPTKVMPLHSAASARNVAMGEALLERGAPVSARQAVGWTALHAAAQNGDKAMVELLLKHGADPRMTNDEGITAVDLAKKGGHADVVALLER